MKSIIHPLKYASIYDKLKALDNEICLCCSFDLLTCVNSIRRFCVSDLGIRELCIYYDTLLCLSSKVYSLQSSPYTAFSVAVYLDLAVVPTLYISLDYA